MTANDKRTTWNNRWGQADFAPFWLSDSVPKPVVHALESGVFVPGDRLLEIGCGSGYLAAYLAEKELYVTAIDIAENAIARAITRFNRTDGKLTYKVVDFCDKVSNLKPVDAAIDCGCFHALSDDAKTRYEVNLARYLKLGGTFLLMHKSSSPISWKEVEDEDLCNQTKLWFGQNFDLVSHKTMVFGQKEKRKKVKGLAFILRRK